VPFAGNIPARTTSTVPNSLFQCPLDLIVILNNRLMLDLDGMSVVAEDWLHELDGVVSLVLQAEDHARMPGKAVGSKEDEEVGKPIKSCSPVELRAS
jgi:hypothetical protein